MMFKRFKLDPETWLRDHASSATAEGSCKTVKGRVGWALSSADSTFACFSCQTGGMQVSKVECTISIYTHSQDWRFLSDIEGVPALSVFFQHFSSGGLRDCYSRSLSQPQQR
jgi:hypothetical protein